MNAPTVAEIVAFRLVPGVCHEDFTAAAHEMTSFLRGTHAMVTRTLSVDTDGLWTDHITWISADAAKKAAAEMFNRAETKPFMDMIDTEHMAMHHTAIQLHLPPE